MRIDPTDPVETPTPDPADAAAELSAAMDAGIAAATPEPAEVVETPEPEVQAEPPVPGTPEALAAEQAAADAAKEAEATPAEEDAGKVEADALGLKGKANERFRSMAEELKTLAPLKAELEKHGITDIATQLPALMKNAQDGADMVSMVTETGATPDQFGATLNYLQLVNKGDPASLEQAYTALSGELADLAKLLNKEVPGVFDPLTEHPDLQEEVDAGMSRKHALEIAQSRATTKIEGARREQASKATEQQTAAQQAASDGANALRAWEAQHLANPLYMQRRDQLSAKVADIRKDFPPSQWVAATKLAFDAIMAVPVATPPPAKKPPPGPVRPGVHHGTHLTPAVYDDPEAAMEAGIAAASVG